MSLEQALTQLSIKMTGKTPDVKNIEGIIQFIAENYTASGGGGG